MQREQRTVHLHRQVLAAAERPADTGEMDPHLLDRKTEARCDLRPVDVQPLRGDVDVDAAFAVGHRNARLGPEEGLILAPDLVDALDADLPRRLGIAVPDHQAPHDVRAVVLEIAMARRRPVRVEIGQLGRALHVGDRLERLVVDADLRGCTACLLGMLGRD